MGAAAKRGCGEKPREKSRRAPQTPPCPTVVVIEMDLPEASRSARHPSKLKAKRSAAATLRRV